MFYERKRMELFSSPGDISVRLDGDRHSRGEAIPDSYVHYKVHIYNSGKCSSHHDLLVDVNCRKRKRNVPTL